MTLDVFAVTRLQSVKGIDTFRYMMRVLQYLDSALF